MHDIYDPAQTYIDILKRNKAIRMYYVGEEMVRIECDKPNGYTDFRIVSIFNLAPYWKNYGTWRDQRGK